jgi:hypothetical protein
VGRGRAHDTLDEGEAEKVRLLIRRWREQKGLNNQDLAYALDWRKTRVVDMLSAGRPLRRSNVVELLRAMRKAKARTLQGDARAETQGANDAIDRELRRLQNRPLSPPALIAASDIRAVAAHLAAVMSEGTPGIGKKRSLLLAQQLERALRRAAPEMAYMFYKLFADSRKTNAMGWIISGYSRQLEAMGVELKGKP